MKNKQRLDKNDKEEKKRRVSKNKGKRRDECTQAVDFAVWAHVLELI